MKTHLHDFPPGTIDTTSPHIGAARYWEYFFWDGFLQNQFLRIYLSIGARPNCSVHLADNSLYFTCSVEIQAGRYKSFFRGQSFTLIVWFYWQWTCRIWSLATNGILAAQNRKAKQTTLMWMIQMFADSWQTTGHTTVRLWAVTLWRGAHRVHCTGS